MPVPIRRCDCSLIQSQVRLSSRRVRPVAMETLVSKYRPHVAVVLDGRNGGSLGGSLERPVAMQASDQDDDRPDEAAGSPGSTILKVAAWFRKSVHNGVSGDHDGLFLAVVDVS